MFYCPLGHLCGRPNRKTSPQMCLISNRIFLRVPMVTLCTCVCVAIFEMGFSFVLWASLFGLMQLPTAN